jgi:hypothetical protein
METSTGILSFCAVRTRRLWWAVAAVSTALMAIGFAIRPHIPTGSWASALPVIALAGLLGMILCNTPDTEILAWLSSCACLAGAFATLGFAVGLGPAWWLAAALLSAVYIALTARTLLSAANA